MSRGCKRSDVKSEATEHSKNSPGLDASAEMLSSALRRRCSHAETRGSHGMRRKRSRRRRKERETKEVEQFCPLLHRLKATPFGGYRRLTSAPPGMRGARPEGKLEQQGSPSNPRQTTKPTRETRCATGRLGAGCSQQGRQNPLSLRRQALRSGKKLASSGT